MNRSTIMLEPTKRFPEHPDGSSTERIWNSNGPPERMPMKLLKKIRSAVLGIIIALAIAAGIVATKLSQFRTMGAAAARQTMPPQLINVTEAREEQWQPR